MLDTISSGTHSTTIRVQHPPALLFRLGSHHNGSAQIHYLTSTTCAKIQLEARTVHLPTLGLTQLPQVDRISTLSIQPMDHWLLLTVYLISKLETQ